MNDYDDKWEKQINALLDGELGEADARQLKAAAADDRILALAIVEAYQLQRAMDTLHIEKAPAGLSKRLRAIPRQERSAPRSVFFRPQWVVALATIPLIIVSVSLMQPKTPSAQELAQARHDLAVAFTYLDKVGHFTAREIKSEVGETLTDAVAGSVLRNIKSQYQSSKEKKV